MKSAAFLIVFGVILFYACACGNRTDGSSGGDMDTTTARYNTDTMQPEAGKAKITGSDLHKVRWRLTPDNNAYRISNLKLNTMTDFVNPRTQDEFDGLLMIDDTLRIYAEVSGPANQNCTLFVWVDSNSCSIIKNTGNSGLAIFNLKCIRQ